MQVTEAATVQMKGKIFGDPFFNASKIQTCARRLRIKYDSKNEGAVYLTGTWQAISEFRKILRGEIVHYLARYKSNGVKLDTKLPEVEKPEASPPHNSAKGIINMSSLSGDVIALMKKCGVYKNDHLTYDIEGGGVTVECPGDDETATIIAEEFQTQYRQLMMGGKLKEHSFPVPSTFNKQQVDELVSQYNNEYSQSIFKHDSENNVIKCLTMNSRQLNHIKSKVKESFQQPAASSRVGATGTDSPTSMSLSLPEGRRVTLKQADLTQEVVDAIVNAVNDALSHVGGVSLAINKASNGAVQQQSTVITKQHGFLQVGQAVHTGAGGALKCKYIIHTVGPKQYEHKDKSHDLLWMACMNTLQLAEKLGVTSLAIPPISSGIFGVPKDVVAKTIINAVCQYPCHPGGLLSDVRIVIIDDPTFEAFKPFFIDARANTTVVTQPQGSVSTHTKHLPPQSPQHKETEGITNCNFSPNGMYFL